MDKPIISTFMLIVGIVLSTFLFNIVYPAVKESGEALATMKGRIDQRMRTDIVIVHVAGELDSQGTWQDVNGDGDFDVFVWVKNVGSVRISALQYLDVFYGPEGAFYRVPYVDEADSTYPHWTWELENDTAWNPAATVRITIHDASIPARGRYYIKVALPVGVSAETFFGM